MNIYLEIKAEIESVSETYLIHTIIEESDEITCNYNLCNSKTEYFKKGWRDKQVEKSIIGLMN